MRRASHARSGDERFAWDSYRRFVQMYGNVVIGIPGERFEAAIAAAKAAARGHARHRARRAALRELTLAFKSLLRVPRADPREQLHGAIRAVFDSWQGERAIAYRRINRIPDEWGTAVNVQQMVFGNLGETQRQRRRVLARRADRRARALGRLPANAQGEDVVSGVRTPRDISELREWLPRRPRRS